MTKDGSLDPIHTKEPSLLDHRMNRITSSRSYRSIGEWIQLPGRIDNSGVDRSLKWPKNREHTNMFWNLNMRQFVQVLRILQYWTTISLQNPPGKSVEIHIVRFFNCFEMVVVHHHNVFISLVTFTWGLEFTGIRPRIWVMQKTACGLHRARCQDNTEDRFNDLLSEVLGVLWSRGTCVSFGWLSTMLGEMLGADLRVLL